MGGLYKPWFQAGLGNWVPKIGYPEIFGHPIFQGRPQYTLIVYNHLTCIYLWE